MYEFSPVSDRITRMKARYRDTPFTLDTERALIVTETYRKHKHAPASLKPPSCSTPPQSGDLNKEYYQEGDCIA